MNSTDFIFTLVYLIPVTKCPIDSGVRYVKSIFNFDLFIEYKYGSYFLILSNKEVLLIKSVHFFVNSFMLLYVSILYSKIFSLSLLMHVSLTYPFEYKSYSNILD